MKEVIHSENAPSAIGPYSQAVKVDNMVYTAGQIALDPSTGELRVGTLKDEVELIMSNLSAILEKAGTSFDNVVKTTIFMKDLQQFKDVNEIYAQYFKDKPPARSTVQVAALPKGVSVEIDMIAVIP